MALNRFERKALLPYGQVTRIARRLRRSVPHVSMVLNDRRRDARVERALAEAMGRPVHEVFPVECAVAA
jgi:hypothetical protein